MNSFITSHNTVSLNRPTICCGIFYCGELISLGFSQFSLIQELLSVTYNLLSQILSKLDLNIINGLADDFKLDTTPPVLVIPHGKNHGISSTKGVFFSSQ
jgi:hypothetical protein